MPKIPNYRFEIPEAALGLHLFAAEPAEGDDTPVREGFDFICIESEAPKRGKDRYVHAVATNGYHLIHLRWIPDPGKDTVPDGMILISGAQAKEFLKSRRPKDTRYWISEEDGAWIVAGDHGERAELDDSPANYPEWQKIMPTRQEKPKKAKDAPPEVEIGLNWTYLEIFCKFSKKYLGRSGFKLCMPQQIDGPILLVPVSVMDPHVPKLEAIEVEYFLNDGVTEMEYVLMPLRV